MAVVQQALGEDLAGGDVQGGEEGSGAVAEVAVRHAFNVAEPEGQDGLGTLQDLDLVLLVDTQHSAWSGGWR